MNLRERARDALRSYEAMRWESIPWRYRALAAFAYPRSVLRVLAEWHRQFTAVPGYRAHLVTRDMYAVVESVKTREVVCEVASGQFRYYHPEWPERVPESCERVYESFPRSRMGWWH